MARNNVRHNWGALHRKGRKTPESKQTKTIPSLIKYFSGEGGISQTLSRELYREKSLNKI